jgi:squalene-hopene/tetraprenyl-beta-curcumene cyclase
MAESAGRPTPAAAAADSVTQAIQRGICYIVSTQNRDGGWGDTDRDPSNIATTALALAALRLTGFHAEYSEVYQRAEAYFRAEGAVEGIVCRYGPDRTFAAPILATCALAGMVPWKEVPALPFELALLPQSWLGMVGLPVVSYAIPALVAIGQLQHTAIRGRTSLTGLLRQWCREGTLAKVAHMQPTSGGFLEAVPLTAFVVLSLSALGRVSHPIVQKGVEFLLKTARANGSWPVDVNLATWVTTLACQALSLRSVQHLEEVNWRWLLGCQHQRRHPFTGAAPGGWGWTDQPGAVPDADDTAGALVALGRLRKFLMLRDARRESHSMLGNRSTADLPSLAIAEVDRAAAAGLRWLIGLQNNDGGWPTFCRGWGKLPFDRSAVDLTAHAIRAITVWLDILTSPDVCTRIAKARGWLPGRGGKAGDGRGENASDVDATASLGAARFPPLQRLIRARERGLRFLQRTQRPDGAWEPLWFGNPFEPGELNLVYGTGRVLLALAGWKDRARSEVEKALVWLVSQQNQDGGWGHRGSQGPPFPLSAGALPSSVVSAGSGDSRQRESTIEETAWAVEALAAALDACGETILAEEAPLGRAVRTAVCRGASALAEGILSGRWPMATPLGLYFARLWYYEELYPLVFSVAALARVLNLRAEN